MIGGTRKPGFDDFVQQRNRTITTSDGTGAFGDISIKAGTVFLTGDALVGGDIRLEATAPTLDRRGIVITNPIGELLSIAADGDGEVLPNRYEGPGSLTTMQYRLR